MSTLFILFFMSLIAIIIMISRKLALVRNGEVIETGAHPFIPDVQKIRHFTYKNFKRYEHIALVIILRLYVRFANFIKSKYAEVKAHIKYRILLKRGKDGVVEMSGAEANKFLKIISEYKHKIRHIKHKIKEEEGIE